jgi:uncharacterized protein YndB with AHSA1/START domain
MSTHATIPAVRRSVTVERPVEEAFRFFTEELSTWWPLEKHSLGAGTDDPAESAAIEARVGGRVVERRSSGAEAIWGTVLVWEPPHRLVLSWQPNPDSPAATELEVRFTAEGTGTRVELEHRGWESLGAGAEAARADYDGGWVTVIGRFAEALES